MWDDKGQLMKMRGSDKPMPRPKGVIPPCFRCDKVSDQSPKINGHKTFHYAVEVTEKSWAAITFHEECEAVNCWPKNIYGEVDPIVKRNAAIIKSHRDSHERQEQKSTLIQAFKILSMQA